jgi:enoyl-CoA hydratase
VTEEASTTEDAVRPEVLTEQRDRILVITINRPQAKNSVNAAISRGLADAMDRLDDDAGLSVGVLTGAGGSFCAGMDLKAFARGENVVVEGRGMGFTERPPVKPVIAAVEGYALTGDNLTAARAFELGLVNVLAEPGRALDAAIALAEKITANGPLAVAATKRIITESRGWSPETMFAEQMKILLPVFGSNDAKEGAVAFAEKRPPRWSGT